MDSTGGVKSNFEWRITVTRFAPSDDFRDVLLLGIDQARLLKSLPKWADVENKPN